MLTDFDTPLMGGTAWLVRSDGVELDLPVGRWHAPATGEDGWLLDRCAGPAIDLGCGPGRLVEALVRRGLPALGVDVSRVAQQACRRRRAPMVRRDVFSPLPGEGRWRHVLLADGNIGIGGDPLRLLRRAARLVSPIGTVLVETDEHPEALWRARLHTGMTGTSVSWASVGAAALGRVAAAAGMRPTASYRGVRSFVELRLLPSGNGSLQLPARAGPRP